MSVEVKICGVTRPEDGRTAALAGARYVGVILTPGFGRSLTLSEAGRVLDAAEGVLRVGVMVDPAVDGVVAAARSLALDVVQLHGSETPEVVEAVSRSGPWLVWKAVRGGHGGLQVLAGYRPWADGLVVDAWDPNHRGGGTGRSYPWEGVGSEVRAAFPDGRFVAAGGLTPENVATAVRTLCPDAVDVSSGVEAALGRKDPDKVRAFIDAAVAASP